MGEHLLQRSNPNDVGKPFVFRFDSMQTSEVTHGVTSRYTMLPDDGDFSFFTGTDPEGIMRNRAFWSSQIDVSPDRLVLGRQVHGARVHVVTSSDVGRGACGVTDAIDATDALITAERNVPLAVMSADCVPIVLHDPIQGVIGAVHAGWRGTVNGIAIQALRAMQRHFGTNPEDVRAGLGPSIGPCCYNVGPEVIQAWDDLGVDHDRKAVSDHDEQLWFDLWMANCSTLEIAGLRSDNISQSKLCTRCHANRYFSRRSGQAHRGLFATIIALT